MGIKIKKVSPGIVFKTQEDAELVKQAMKEVLLKYTAVSVEDLNTLAGLPSIHEDNKLGWTNLDSAEIQQIEKGYLLKLPELEEI